MRKTVKVTGTTFKNEDGTSRNEILGILYDHYFHDGHEDKITVEIRADDENEYDENAVAVFAKASGIVYIDEEGEQIEAVCDGQIGYLPADKAPKARRIMHDGRLRHVEFSKMGCSSGRGAPVYAELVLTISEQIEDDEGNVYDIR